MKREGWLFKLGMVGSVTLVMLGIWWVLHRLGMPNSLSAQAISEWLNAHGPLGPLLLVLMMILAVVVGPIPTLPISAAAGLAFGIFQGTLVAAVGAMIGALVAFFVARLLGRELLRKRLSHHPLFSADGAQHMLFWTVFLTRLIPLFSFALVSYAAGVTAIATWRFAMATFLGMLPMTVIFSGLGTTFELNPVLTVTAALAVLTLMTLLPYYLRRHPTSRLARWLHLATDAVPKNRPRR
ncbi:TVP38/TMEM64 family protein [Halomonas sp. ZH2S]|uniref:TVP38/TMEM64 family membrane protein n=1 Tax=Vreelandella zhuhanensis TaxID=2684210 RepID=A0A7X3GZR3_9GAMM|nr:TVP38/TMEM64 family protein [Halomonas zhuhanensis]MWJ26935.1 TVP38/TMEM64 family protein [Halomonas zhuhanensis]